MLPETLQNVAVATDLESNLPGSVADGSTALGEVVLFVEPSRIVEVCRFLKQSRQFNRLSGITAIDRIPAEPRFEVVYLLHSLASNERVRLKCLLPSEDPEIESVTSVWAGANWYERETYDMFGIRFRNHPNLTRILMPDYWEGHPLRRDFPVHGHKYDYKDE